MSFPVAHNLNRLLTGLMLALCFVVPPLVLPPAIETFRNFVQNYRANLSLNTPFETSSYYYHAFDEVDFVVERDANFEAAFTGTKLLERIYPGTTMSKIVAREPISGGIEAKSTHILASNILPKTLATGKPLDPGIYRFRYPTSYSIYNYVHNRTSRTKNFRVLPDDVPIVEGMKPDQELIASENDPAFK